MGNKSVLHDFETDTVVGTRRQGLNISKPANLWSLHKIIPNIYREWLEKENKAMRGNSIGENPLLVIEIEGECAIKMKLIDGQE